MGHVHKIINEIKFGNVPLRNKIYSVKLLKIFFCGTLSSDFPSHYNNINV